MHKKEGIRFSDTPGDTYLHHPQVKERKNKSYWENLS